MPENSPGKKNNSFLQNVKIGAKISEEIFSTAFLAEWEQKTVIILTFLQALISIFRLFYIIILICKVLKILKRKKNYFCKKKIKFWIT